MLDLRANIEALEDEFFNLAEQLHLKMLHKSVDDVKCSIINLPSYVNKFIHKLWNDIEASYSIKTVNDLFTILNTKVWSFLDYYLLEQLIRKFGDDALKERMKSYICRIQNFKETTLVVDFIKCWGGHKREIPGYVKLEVKCARRDMTIAELEHFREEIRVDYFRSLVSECASCMYYNEFREGCFVVSWLIPSELADILKSNSQSTRDSFKDFEVSYADVTDDEGMININIV